MKKLVYIDALRGLAILGVLMVHTNQYGHLSLPWFLEKIAWKGAMGVQLFFIASAFTLFLSYSHRLRSEPFPIQNFFIRRFFRIAPMYYLGVMYYLFQDGFGPRYWLGDAPGITPANIGSNFLFLHGFNPYWITSIVPGGWSIAVEMLFYGLLPILYASIQNSRQAFYFFIASLLIQLALQLSLANNPLIGHAKLWEEYLTLYLPAQLPVFNLGILLYFVVYEEKFTSLLTGKPLLLVSTLLLALLVNQEYFPIPGWLFLILPEHVLFGIAFFGFALALGRYPWSGVVNPVITYLGKISFSMYLIHFGVLHWLDAVHFTDYVNQAIIDFCIRYALVLALTVLLATFFYEYVEVPGQRLGRWLISRFEKSRVASVSLQQPSANE